MPEDTPTAVRDDAAAPSEPHRLVDHFFRHEYARLVATLTGKFGVENWDLVEDVVQSALQRALSTWSRRGIPANPAGWLHRVASNLAIDSLRRDQRQADLPADLEPASEDAGFDRVETVMQDHLLRMIFYCCAPSVPQESQIALALKALCGFGNREIARALLTTEANIAKRVTRAKNRLRESGQEPSSLTKEELQSRLPHVQAVIYLLFNEGYSSSVVDKVIREELCEEAIRLALVLAEHAVTRGPQASALVALLLFHASRLEARIDGHGALLLLSEQDRSLWDRRLIQEAFRWLKRAACGEVMSRYHAEAFIAAEHCQAASLEETNWQRVAWGYDLLCTIEPTPVHQLSRAIAIGRRDGPEAGLTAFSAIESDQLAKDYYLWHATKAELTRLTGDVDSSRAALQRAWELAPTRAERELICRKLDELSSAQENGNTNE